MSVRPRQPGQPTQSQQDPYRLFRRGGDRQAESDTERPRYRATGDPQRDQADGRPNNVSRGYTSDSPATASVSRQRVASSSRTLHHPTRPTVASPTYFSKPQPPIPVASSSVSPPAHPRLPPRSQTDPPDPRIHLHKRTISTPTPNHPHDRPSPEEHARTLRNPYTSRVGVVPPASTPEVLVPTKDPSTSSRDIRVPVKEFSSSSRRQREERPRETRPELNLERRDDAYRDRPSTRERELRDKEIREHRDARDRDRERETRERREARDREARERPPRAERDQDQLRELRDRDAMDRDTRERRARQRDGEREAELRDKESRDREARLKEREAKDREGRERRARDRELDSRERRMRERDADREARDREARDRALKEQEAKERRAREREAREKEVREQERQAREREIKEQERQAREYEARVRTKEREIREREIMEQEARERKAREREAEREAMEQEAKERRAKEREAEREAMEQEARERRAKEREAEREARDKEAREQERQAKERRAAEREERRAMERERELKEREAYEREIRERELRAREVERAAKERESREREVREREAREREVKELEAQEREALELQLREREAQERALREARFRQLKEREARERDAKEREAREREVKEREAREREAREHEVKERELREHEAREREAVERQLKEREIQELEAKERETQERMQRDAREREARVRQLKEREARERDAKERELRDREAREREALERQLKEREIQEREAKERETQERMQREARDREARIRQLKEREARENDAKERELREREAREREAREREAREREAREHEALERQLKEREAKEREAKEREAKERETQERMQREARERETKEREAHEREAQERMEAKEREIKERLARERLVEREARAREAERLVRERAAKEQEAREFEARERQMALEAMEREARERLAEREAKEREHREREARERLAEREAKEREHREREARERQAEREARDREIKAREAFREREYREREAREQQIEREAKEQEVRDREARVKEAEKSAREREFREREAREREAEREAREREARARDAERAIRERETKEREVKEQAAREREAAERRGQREAIELQEREAERNLQERATKERERYQERRIEADKERENWAKSLPYRARAPSSKEAEDLKNRESNAIPANHKRHRSDDVSSGAAPPRKLDLKTPSYAAVVKPSPVTRSTLPNGQANPPPTPRSAPMYIIPQRDPTPQKVSHDRAASTPATVTQDPPSDTEQLPRRDNHYRTMHEHRSGSAASKGPISRLEKEPVTEITPRSRHEGKYQSIRSMFTEDQEPVAELKVSEPALNSHTAAASMLPSSTWTGAGSSDIPSADPSRLEKSTQGTGTAQTPKSRVHDRVQTYEALRDEPPASTRAPNGNVDLNSRPALVAPPLAKTTSRASVNGTSHLIQASDPAPVTRTAINRTVRFDLPSPSPSPPPVISSWSEQKTSDAPPTLPEMEISNGSRTYPALTRVASFASSGSYHTATPPSPTVQRLPSQAIEQGLSALRTVTPRSQRSITDSPLREEIRADGGVTLAAVTAPLLNKIAAPHKAPVLQATTSLVEPSGTVTSSHHRGTRPLEHAQQISDDENLPSRLDPSTNFRTPSRQSRRDPPPVITVTRSQSQIPPTQPEDLGSSAEHVGPRSGFPDPARSYRLGPSGHPFMVATTPSQESYVEAESNQSRKKTVAEDPSFHTNARRPTTEVPRDDIQREQSQAPTLVWTVDSRHGAYLEEAVPSDSPNEALREVQDVANGNAQRNATRAAAVDRSRYPTHITPRATATSFSDPSSRHAIVEDFPQRRAIPDSIEGVVPNETLMPTPVPRMLASNPTLVVSGSDGNNPALSAVERAIRAVPTPNAPRTQPHSYTRPQRADEMSSPEPPTTSSNLFHSQPAAISSDSTQAPAQETNPYPQLLPIPNITLRSLPTHLNNTLTKPPASIPRTQAPESFPAPVQLPATIHLDTVSNNLIPAQPITVLHASPNHQNSSGSLHASTPSGSIDHGLDQLAPSLAKIPAPISRLRPPHPRNVSNESVLLPPPSVLPKTQSTRTPMPPITRQESRESKESSKYKKGLFGNMFRSKIPAEKPLENHPLPITNATEANRSQASLQSVGKGVPLPSNSSTSVVLGPAFTENKAPAISVDLPLPSRKEPEQKVFSAFKFLHTKRIRTVSHASVEVQDGQITATNTVIGSPTQSEAFSQMPYIPSARDPGVATQEWRNREEEETRARPKVRRRRPGVVFDVADDGPPSTAPPKKKLSVSRRRS